MNTKTLSLYYQWYEVLYFALQYMFDTTKGITILRCGHTMHYKCVKEMEKHCR